MSLDPVSNGREAMSAAAMGVPRPLLAGTVHVWFLDCPGSTDPSYLELLDDEERGRAMRLRTPEQRDAFTAAHALVRTALSAYGGCTPAAWRYAFSPVGRPSVAEAAELSFSLTHAGPRAAVAVGAGQPLGLDLEPVRPERDSLPLARRFFGPAETDWLTGLPARERSAGFAALWTVKEAVLKARGCGLTEPLRSVEVELDCSGRSVRVQAPGGPWAVRSWSPEAGWRAALAVGTDQPVSVATFRAGPLGPPVPAPEMGPEPSAS
jgi:4'-phosphopantetheinyl transferase